MVKIITFCLMIVSLVVLNTVECLGISQALNVVFKTLTSMFFVMTGFFAAKDAQPKTEKLKLTKYKKLVIMGLIFGMLGDILLVIKFISQGFFIAGVVAFAIGHIFYVIAFTSKEPKLSIVNFIPMMIIMPAFFLLVFLSKKFNFEGLFPCIVFYGLLLTFMLGKSFSLVQFKNKAKSFVTLTLTGVTLFAISDIILLFILFMEMQPLLNNILGVFNLATYYVGQGLIALSLTTETFAVRD